MARIGNETFIRQLACMSLMRNEHYRGINNSVKESFDLLTTYMYLRLELQVHLLLIKSFLVVIFAAQRLCILSTYKKVAGYLTGNITSD